MTESEPSKLDELAKELWQIRREAASLREKRESKIEREQLRLGLEQAKKDAVAELTMEKAMTESEPSLTPAVIRRKMVQWPDLMAAQYLRLQEERNQLKRQHDKWIDIVEFARLFTVAVQRGAASAAQAQNVMDAVIAAGLYAP